MRNFLFLKQIELGKRFMKRHPDLVRFHRRIKEIRLLKSDLVMFNRAETRIMEVANYFRDRGVKVVRNEDEGKWVISLDELFL